VFVAGARGPDSGSDLVVLLALAGGLDGTPEFGIHCRRRTAGIPSFDAQRVELEHWSLGSVPARTSSVSRAAGRIASLVAAVPISLTPAAAAAQHPAADPVPREASAPAVSGPAVRREAPFSDPVDGRTRTPLWARARLHRPTPERAARLVRNDEDRPASGAPGIAVGLPLSIGGGVLLAVGAVVATQYSYCGYYYAGCLPGYAGYASYYAPFFIAGGAMLAVGIPVLAVGGAKQAKRDRWDDHHRAEISLAMAPRRGGWSGQLRVRF
jgi:hypothetical protein